MQTSIDRWERGLKTSGGAIVPAKSWVYPIAFHFDSLGKWSYRSVADIDFDFMVLDENDERQPLPQFSPDKGNETLGVYLAPDGNNRKMIREMRKKAITWSNYIKTGHLQRETAWQSVETTILKSLLYPVPALTLSEQECTSIMAPVLAIGLPASSMNRNYPRKVLYGPINEGGMGLTNLYWSQGLSHIAIIAEHLGKETLTGDLIITSLEMCNVELGIGRNMFSLDHNRYQMLLTDCWLKQVWQFAQENNIAIDDLTSHQVTLQRHNDIFLMEEFCHANFTKSELQQINRCRMHIQATTHADISCGYGSHHSIHAYNVRRDPTIQKRYKWPKQPRPNVKGRRIWRKAIKVCFPLLPNRQMEYQLGPWNTPPSSTWQWHYHPHSRQIYQRAGSTWKIWQRIS